MQGAASAVAPLRSLSWRDQGIALSVLVLTGGHSTGRKVAVWGNVRAVHTPDL